MGGLYLALLLTHGNGFGGRAPQHQKLSKEEE
jgi:hypothetical protein